MHSKQRILHNRLMVIWGNISDCFVFASGRGHCCLMTKPSDWSFCHSPGSNRLSLRCFLRQMAIIDSLVIVNGRCSDVLSLSLDDLIYLSTTTTTLFSMKSLFPRRNSVWRKLLWNFLDIMSLCSSLCLLGADKKTNFQIFILSLSHRTHQQFHRNA